MKPEELRRWSKPIPPPTVNSESVPVERVQDLTASNDIPKDWKAKALALEAELARRRKVKTEAQKRFRDKQKAKRV